MAQATGTFTVSSWDENTYEELDGGGKLTKTTATFAFSGDLDGQGQWDAVMCYCDDGTATYTGYQRHVGTLGGRTGTFVLRADGIFENGEAKSTWQVVDGSATGDLRGLTGGGEAIATSTPPGTYTFEYELA